MNREKTIIDVFYERVEKAANEPVFTYLIDGETKKASLSYHQLEKEARAIAATLQQRCTPGDRALLIYPPGLAFHSAFMGCLLAGVIAVPVYPPVPFNLQYSLEMLQSVIKNSQPKIVLVDKDFQPIMQSFLLREKISTVSIVTTNAIDLSLAADWNKPNLHPEQIAFLQYTSGSTGNPKGVMVTYRNIAHNQMRIQQLFKHAPQGVVITWLPIYHDMGLSNALLQPLYSDMSVIILSPLHFIQKPLRWLQAISDYRGTACGGPNFGFELCVRKITESQQENLDLRSWQSAFNGAEPIRAETLQEFTKKFQKNGFRAETFYPCYGLAESMLLVTGKPQGQPVIRQFTQDGLSGNQAILDGIQGEVMLVSAGQGFLDQRLLIVDPETLAVQPDGRIGEVWLASESIAKGYWQLPDLTDRCFNAYTSEDDGPYFRTGDLGFLLKEELFITGRLKDLIIVHGRKFAPTDIEYLLQNNISGLRAGCIAAFTVKREAEDKLIIVAELNKHHAAQAFLSDVHEKLTAEVMNALAQCYGLHLYEFVIVVQDAIPKTSSGKIQRYKCKEWYEQDRLKVLYRSRETNQVEIIS